MSGDPSFWANFWPNFCSDLIVGTIIAGLVSWIYQRTRRADGKVVAMAVSSEQSTAQLSFSLRNTGGRVLEKDHVYYHVFINANLDPKASNSELCKPDAIIDGRTFIHFRGANNGPAFAGRDYHLFDAALMMGDNANMEAYYLLSTAYGMIPRTPCRQRMARRLPKLLSRLPEEDKLLMYGKVDMESVVSP